MLPRDVDDVESPFHLHTMDKNGKWHEANQLKYVCRQVYLETRALGPHKHTTLIFPSVKYPPTVPVDQRYHPGSAMCTLSEILCPSQHRTYALRRD
jgi:hypothetical protein